MAFIPIPGVCQVAMRFTWDGQEVANVLHVLYSGIPSTTTFLNIAGVFVSWWSSNIRSLVTTAVTLREIAVVDQSTANGIGVLSTAGLPLQGQSVSPALPNSNTLAVKWATGRTGRSFRGRTFHIGLTEGQVLNNQTDAATTAALQSGYTALISALTGAGHSLVVASRFSNNAPRTVGLGTNVGTCSVNPVIDVQRRRLPGRGR